MKEDRTSVAARKASALVMMVRKDLPAFIGEAISVLRWNLSTDNGRTGDQDILTHDSQRFLDEVK